MAPRSDNPEDRLRELVTESVTQGLYDSLVACVADRTSTLFLKHAGEAGPRHLFDLASLTKPIVATAAMQAEVAGELSLGCGLGHYVAGASEALARTPLAQVLRHRSTLAAWVPLYALCHDREQALESIASGRWCGARTPTYSDLGYVLAGAALERVWTCDLGSSIQRLVGTPLGLCHLGYRPQDVETVAPCRIGTEKEVELGRSLPEPLSISALPAPTRGQVQDGNARFLGMAGHAGLFGSIQDVVRFGRAWLEASLGVDGALDPGAVGRALEGRDRYLQGWERSRRDNSAGAALTPSAFGHTGFTGGSLWIDPRAERVFSMLGHRSSALSDLTPLRRRFHRWGSSL